MLKNQLICTIFTWILTPAYRGENTLILWHSPPEFYSSFDFFTLAALPALPCFSISEHTSWKAASKATKLLDFMHFNLTNPMVPNLANVFFIGLGLSESFARTLLGENGYFIGFWHFRPNFKLLWHASKWTLCLQKCWILLIYYVVRLQYNFHAHGKSQRWKTKGGGANFFSGL